VTSQQRAPSGVQLSLLAELADVFAGARLAGWLRGGWALDFLLGEVTRPHSDVDLVTWRRHRQRVHRLLPAHEYALVRELPVQTDFTKHDQTVSVVFVARGPDGRPVVPGIPGWTWRPDALPRRRHTLRGVSWRVVSPEQLLDEKEGYEAGTGRPPRSKDRVSMDLLRRLIAARRAVQRASGSAAR
jgi:hypothetical protein